MCPGDVELALSQANCSRAKAVATIKAKAMIWFGVRDVEQPHGIPAQGPLFRSVPDSLAKVVSDAAPPLHGPKLP